MRTEVRCRECGRTYDGAVVADRFGGACPRCLAGFALEETDEPASEPPPPVDVGATFHGMEVLEVLGRGGMGVVFKARQIALGRVVALKVLSPALAEDAEFAQRFNREAKALATLSHPHIVAVHDFGRDGDVYFIVMEFVDGVSLRDLMSERRLTPAEALKIVPQVCEALEFAHTHGVVHRDIKPENILLDRDGNVKIADFGLAKLAKTGDAATLTRTDVAMGTPQYMAPEQYERMKDVDHRADIYSLGVVFYELLTNELPVGRFDPPSKHVQVDVRIDEVVFKALEKRPERRYQRAMQIKTDVETIARSPHPADPRWNGAALVLTVAALGCAALLRAPLPGAAWWVAGLALMMALVACSVLTFIAAWRAGRDGARSRLGVVAACALAAALVWPLASGNIVSWAAAACTAVVTLPTVLALYAAARRPAMPPAAPPVRHPVSGLALVSVLSSLAVLCAGAVLLIEGWKLFELTQRAMRYAMGHAVYGLVIGGLAAALVTALVTGFLALHRCALGIAGGRRTAGWGIAIAAFALPCVLPTMGARIVAGVVGFVSLIAMGHMHHAAEKAEGVRVFPLAPLSVVLMLFAGLSLIAGTMAGEGTFMAVACTAGAVLAAGAMGLAVASIAIIRRSGGAYKGEDMAVFAMILLVATVATLIIVLMVAPPMRLK